MAFGTANRSLFIGCRAGLSDPDAAGLPQPRGAQGVEAERNVETGGKLG